MIVNQIQRSLQPPLSGHGVTVAGGSGITISGNGLGLITPQINRLQIGGACEGCALGISDEVATQIGTKLATQIMTFSSDIAAAMQPFAVEDRQKIAAAYLAAGGAPAKLTGAQEILDRSVGTIRGTRPYALAWTILSTASMAASAFHGYRRNDSLGWALWWAFMGGLFPIFTPAVALAQGFGKRKR